MLKKFPVSPDMLVILFKRGYYSIILFFIIIIALLASYFFHSQSTISFAMTSQRHKRDMSSSCPHPCRKCPDGLFKLTGGDGLVSCIKSCYSNFHTITSPEEGNSCVRCEDANCRKCDGTKRLCNKCERNYFLNNGKCNLTCPSFKFHHKLLWECLPQCPHLHHNKYCVDKCPYSTFMHNQTCVNDCPSSTYRLRNTCVESCPEGYKQNRKRRKCTSKRGRCKLSPWQRIKECVCHKKSWQKLSMRKIISGHCPGKKLTKYKRCRIRPNEPCSGSNLPIISNSRPHHLTLNNNRRHRHDSRNSGLNNCKSCRLKGKRRALDLDLLSVPNT